MSAIAAALKMPDYQNPQALAALEALPSDCVGELTERLESCAAGMSEDRAKGNSGPDARARRQQLPRLVVGLGRHLARAGEALPERLDTAVEHLAWTHVEHLQSPEAVAEAMTAVPTARLEAILLGERFGRPPTSFWQLLPSCPTPAVIQRAIGVVLGWEKGKLSTSRAPAIAAAALTAAGAPAEPLLNDAIRGMKKEPYRDALVSALAGLPSGGTDALIHALGDSSKAVVSAARAGLLARKPECIPSVDAALAAAKKKALKTRLHELRAELGPVDVETGKTAATTPLEEARQRVDPAEVEGMLDALRGATTQKGVSATLDGFMDRPDALMLALVDAARGKASRTMQLAFDPVYELCYERLPRLAERPLAPWAVADALTSRRKEIAGKAPARAQLAQAAETLGDALRAPLVAALRLDNKDIAYPELYWGWLTEAPTPDTIPLLLDGLGGSKKLRELCQAALVRLGAEGAEAAASVLDGKKATREAAVEVLVQVPTPSVSDAIRARLAKEKDGAIKARLDAALGAAAADLI
ncbi:MAG: hypothetical protein VYE22_24905 [Myxococcota bacterium]|nr:hypothetical protein [Myxococcota bacterium]